MQINGNTVAPSLDGTDVSPCWPAPGSSWNIYTRSANVTPYVTGNGAYTISGYPTGLTTGADPWANPSANPEMEGASLVVLYGQMSSSGTTINATEGQSFTGNVATFTEPDLSAAAGQYTATINWGDASTSAGTVTQTGPGAFSVSGSHTYAEEGTYAPTVTITDNNNSSNTTTAYSTANVADALLTPGALSLSSGGVEGVTPSTASFTFADANPGATTSDFTPLPLGNGGSTTINWGDGSPVSTGTVTQPGGVGNAFTVTGSHQYTEEGTYTVKVNVADDGGSTTTNSGPVTVADAPLTATGLSFVSTNPVSHAVATFTDVNPGATTADFTPLPLGNGGSTTI